MAHHPHRSHSPSRPTPVPSLREVLSPTPLAPLPAPDEPSTPDTGILESRDEPSASYSPAPIRDDATFEDLAAMVPELTTREALADVLGRMATIYSDLKRAFVAASQASSVAPIWPEWGTKEIEILSPGQEAQSTSPVKRASYTWTCAGGHAVELREGVDPPLSCPFKHNNGGGPRCGKTRLVK